MIKKTILIILFLILVLSCGKKGDPDYKAYRGMNSLFRII